MKAETDNPELVAKMLRAFMIGAVARGVNPGCEMQNILILEGEYGVGKTSLVKTLSSIVPGSYCETAVDPQSGHDCAAGSRWPQ